MPPLPRDFVLRQYFPEISLDKDRFEEQTVDFRLVAETLRVVKKLGWDGFTLLIDRADEDRRWQNDSKLTASFLEPLLTDSNILLSSDVQVVVTIWDISFKHLTAKVRSQKYFSPRLQWIMQDLEGVLNRRLFVFSHRRVTDYRSLFDPSIGESLYAKLFTLANGNPRDLWHVFRHIFHAQFRLDPDAKGISERAVLEGMSMFVEEFNYYEYYPNAAKKPGQRGLSRLDVYGYMGLILRMGRGHVTFTRSQFQDATGVSGSSVSGYLGQMKNIGLITDAGREGNRQYYRIVDPKVIYALENGITIRNVV